MTVLDDAQRAVRQPSRRVRVQRLGPAEGAEVVQVAEVADLVVVEEPLRVHVQRGGERALLGSTMRTPGHDLELAAGLAVGEGVVRRASQILAVRPCRDGQGPVPNEVSVVVAESATLDLARLGRVGTPSSACGLCGRDELEAIVAGAPAVTREVRIERTVLAGLPAAMRGRQRLFDRTGGLHAAALATTTGQLLAVREDVGRHNAVDKVVGAAALGGWSADVLVISGRAGFEIVQKAAMAGIPVVAAVSAPTSLAVEVARACGMTLAAFVRDGRMSVYAGAERIC
jgi:FdhD protein